MDWQSVAGEVRQWRGGWIKFRTTLLGCCFAFHSDSETMLRNASLRKHHSEGICVRMLSATFSSLPQAIIPAMGADKRERKVSSLQSQSASALVYPAWGCRIMYGMTRLEAVLPFTVPCLAVPRQINKSTSQQINKKNYLCKSKRKP